jgi:hypothetical protein
MCSNGRVFKCRACDKWYASQDSLAYHLRLDCPVLNARGSGTVKGHGRGHERSGQGAHGVSESGAGDRTRDVAPSGEGGAATSVGIFFAHETPHHAARRAVPPLDVMASHAGGVDDWWSQMTAVVSPFVPLSAPSNPPPSACKVLHRKSSEYLQPCTLRQELSRASAQLVRRNLTQDCHEQGASLLPGRAMIEDLMPGGPADRADLRPGDVVISVDGQNATAENVNRLLKGQDRVGSVVVVSIERNRRVVEVELVRVAASHLQRAHDVLQCIDRLSQNFVAQDVCKTSPYNSALNTPNIPTGSTVPSNTSVSVAGGARDLARNVFVCGFESQRTALLGALRTLVIEHLRLQQIEQSCLADMLAQTQTEIIDVLNALAAALRLVPPKVLDLSSECQGLRQSLLQVETSLLECKQARAEEDRRVTSLIVEKESELQVRVYICTCTYLYVSCLCARAFTKGDQAMFSQQCHSKLAAAQQELATAQDQHVQQFDECQGLRQSLLQVETSLLECKQARAEEDRRVTSLIVEKESELQVRVYICTCTYLYVSCLCARAFTKGDQAMFSQQCHSKLAAAQQELATAQDQHAQQLDELKYRHKQQFDELRHQFDELRRDRCTSCIYKSVGVCAM